MLLCVKITGACGRAGGLRPGDSLRPAQLSQTGVGCGLTTLTRLTGWAGRDSGAECWLSQTYTRPHPGHTSTASCSPICGSACRSTQLQLLHLSSILSKFLSALPSPTYRTGLTVDSQACGPPVGRCFSGLGWVISSTMTRIIEKSSPVGHL